jgi:3-isopropylmalate/(R)-2-methylmalate dehydratase large subunit
VRSGDLVIGADSHTVTCGALDAFATGVGSSDLAAAMMTGQIWLRVPASIRVEITGVRPAGVSAKDIALALVGELGADGASYSALEFCGAGLPALTLDDRMVLANLSVEAGAKAAIFPVREDTGCRMSIGEGRSGSPTPGVVSHSRTVTIDLADLSPRIALPHAPDHVRPLSDAVGTPVQMVFVGTCTGGRASDFRDCLRAIDAAGGRLAPGVQLVITPASREVLSALLADGTMGRFEAMGAIITTPGCGACCGTSGVIPGDGMTVLSTANRNFKARMGNPTASIYLASPAACGAAAVAGCIADPSGVRSRDRAVRTEDRV